MNDGIFHILLSVPHNNVMDLDNVMRLVNLYAIKRKIRLGAKNNDSLQSWPMMGLSFENDDFIAHVGGPEWIHALEIFLVLLEVKYGGQHNNIKMSDQVGWGREYVM